MEGFVGCHSEWNLGSPGGWDYQRITQIIGKAVWQRLNAIRPCGVELDFDHPLFFPVNGFVAMLHKVFRDREGSNPGLIAVVAEEETLADVTENINLARHLSSLDGVTGALMAPQELELRNGRVCWHGRSISILFMDFNSDVLLALHRKHDLSPVLQAVREKRVINPRGTEPINVKSMFEVITGPWRHRFHPQTIARTPWTRQFYARRTEGPRGETIPDLIEWTRSHWPELVLKPERGYSGKGVRVGEVNPDADAAIQLALTEGNYIVQERIPLPLWAEDVPTLDPGRGRIVMERYQTDFRCLMGPDGLFGFMGRYGGVPTNVGSGGGVQPLALLRSDMSVRKAVDRIHEAMMAMTYQELAEVHQLQQQLALEHRFTYLLGPIKIALRPRVVTESQLAALSQYGRGVWLDSLEMERMWLAGELDEVVKIEEEELAIARLQPWGGAPAIIAADGLFGFGAQPESP
ncbi:MAG TPA: hypothetical protein DCZ69_02465 [Syntrophobacteraceae bacterium]|nr:hypothetical protein [Syntrophobacteraceae bacterium]HBZ56732.1 hypothetical protein [Syntrophobacteraceae bacterium]